MTDLMSPGIVTDAIRALFIFFDNIFYSLLSYVYQIFFNVATAEIFSNSLIRSFYYKCQLIIGVFMLFKLSVTILSGIVDPAKATDKKTGAGKVISRIITSLVILALITPIDIPNAKTKWEKELHNNGILFGALYSLQERILNNNTIGKLILDSGETTTENQGKTLSESGDEFAANIFKGFFRVNLVPEKKRKAPADGKDPETNKENWVCDIEDDVQNVYKEGSVSEAMSLINYTCEDADYVPIYSDIKDVFERVAGTAKYAYAYSPIGGIVALIISIILILYTIDVAIRSLKLAVLRVIAPIPIISHMSISAKEAKGQDSFSTWVSTLTSTYLELFIRLAIMYFAIYLVQQIISEGMFIKTSTGMVGIFSFVFIAIGIFLFARQAPKFIENVLGIQSTSAHFGLSAGLSAIGARRAGGTWADAFNAARETTDANINAYNSGKAPPTLGNSYNSGRDLAARMITGNDKMTFNEMRRGERMLANEGITTQSADRLHKAALNSKAFTERMTDDAKSGRYTYMNSNGTYEHYKWKDSRGVHDVTNADEMSLALAQQREISGQLESADNKVDAEIKRYGANRSWRDKGRMDNTGNPSHRTQARADSFNTENNKPVDSRTSAAGVDITEHN